MSFQLCSVNEFGDRSIHGRSDDLLKLQATAKQMINTENMDNALTFDAKMDDWVECAVEVFDTSGNPMPHIIYAGRTGRGDHIFYDLNDRTTLKPEAVGGEIRFYVGEFRRDRKKPPEVYYAKTPKGKFVNSFKDQRLEGKTLYYIQPPK